MEGVGKLYSSNKHLNSSLQVFNSSAERLNSFPELWNFSAELLTSINFK